MITGALMTVLGGIVSAVLGVLPTVPAPSWLSDADGAMGTVFQFLGSMSVWFPVDLALTVLAAYLAIRITAFGIKLARIVASFLTLGGGSAA